jgi:hypothetical protein
VTATASTAAVLTKLSRVEHSLYNLRRAIFALQQNSELFERIIANQRFAIR